MSTTTTSNRIDVTAIATRCCMGIEKGWNACRAHIFGEGA